MSMHMSIEMSMHMSSVHMSVYMSVHVSMHMSIQIPIQMTMHMSTHMAIHLPMHMSIHTSIHMFMATTVQYLGEPDVEPHERLMRRTQCVMAEFEVGLQQELPASDRLQPRRASVATSQLVPAMPHRHTAIHIVASVRRAWRRLMFWSDTAAGARP